jgi:hypothetical protein
MSVNDIDREEWAAARDAAYRDGDDLFHAPNCKCRDCIADEIDYDEDYR